MNPIRNLLLTAFLIPATLFWWRHDMEFGERKINCISGRGAGGQFILLFPELDLIAVVTAHNKGMGNLLKTFPERVLPALIRKANGDEPVTDFENSIAA